MDRRARRTWGSAALLIILLGFAGAKVQAQAAPAAAVLIADDIQITADRRLIAKGNVEAYQDGTRLTAGSIIYDPDTGMLTVTGPITIDDGNGTLIVADQAELSNDMQRGLLSGARMVLNDQLQMAAVQIDRVDGKYTQLYKTVATSCKVCADDPRPPLWQIRARRVVHDIEGQQLYFDEAQLRVGNVPILYLPRMRLPDPTQTRATGFLMPSVTSDSRLGNGFRMPYFIKIGDHRDLLLTPYIASNTRTLGFRYRQAFRTGRIIFEGAWSNDSLTQDSGRGYLFGAGQFDLRNDFKLQFDFETVSDEAYLNDYDFYSKDRLDSQIQITRTRRDSFKRLTYINYNSLRDDEDNDVLPTDVVEGLYEGRFFPRALGGELRLSAVAHAHERRSTVDFDANSDGIADGRDVARLSFDAAWLHTFQMGGLQLQSQFGLAADVININDDAAFNGTESGYAPSTAFTLRYPLVKHTAGGARYIIEPVAQVVWVGGDALNVPNDESTRVEFDEGNLIALSRFPSTDRRERGWSTAYGATWARFDPEGWDLSITAGQVVHQDAQTDFSYSSGLSDRRSDYLLAGHLRFNGGLSLSGRTIINDNFDMTKAEVRGEWQNSRLDLSGSYVWIDEDTEVDRLEPIGEISFESAYKLDRFWTASLDMRYDIEDRRTAEAAAGLSYENECVLVGLSISRRFADSTTIEPSTSLGLTVSIRGFSANSGQRTEVRSCGKQAR